jgi:hypothetical protein
MSKKLFELERHADEPFNELHVHLRIPKPPRVLPDATRGHLRAALRETLLASQSLVDALIEKIEPKPSQPAM